MPTLSISPKSPICNFFNAEECAFLARMFVAYPHIQTNFEHYLHLRAKDRFEKGIEDAKGLLRAGWVARGISNPESVFDHSERLASWVSSIELPEGIDREHLVAMAKTHDMPEVIITDFKPSDGISSDDKDRLELLAARVLFAHHPEQLAHIEEYAALVTPESHILHDLDKLEAVRQALVYEGYYPEKMGKLYSEFKAYCEPRLKTDTGRELLASIEASASNIRATARLEFQANRKHGIAE